MAYRPPQRIAEKSDSHASPSLADSRPSLPSFGTSATSNIPLDAEIPTLPEEDAWVDELDSSDETFWVSDDQIEERLDVSDIEKKYHVSLEEGLENVVVIDQLPVVPEAKKDLLVKFLQQKFLQAIYPVKDIDVRMPMETRKQDGKEELWSKGYAFLEFKNAQFAQLAIKQLNGRPFDKSHALAVNKFTDVERFSSIDVAFKKPHFEPFQPREHLKWFMMDRQGRDQWAIYRGDDVSLQWNRKSDKPETIIQRPNWTEKHIQWSPFGTYMVSIHGPGAQLWGGQSWKRIARFLHPNVSHVAFSPNENYLVTFSQELIVLPPLGHPARDTMPFTNEDEGKNLIFWSVSTGQIIRSFLVQKTEDVNNEKRFPWPIFKFSHDDKYVARLNRGTGISVYQLPEMVLLQKKSIKIEGIEDFEWAPASAEINKKSNEHLISYWTPEIENHPARVALMSIPSKETVRTKTLFNVSDCKLYWQNDADFLCVKVDRSTKTKKIAFSSLEVFHVSEKDIPVEVIECSNEIVLSVHWEPHGDRFAVISTSDPTYGMQTPNTLRTNLSFYALERNKGVLNKFKILPQVQRKTFNAVFWSPKGRFLIAASFGSQSNCEIEFYDLDYEGDKPNTDLPANLQHIATQEHYGITGAQWDQSGRYLITYSSVWRHRVENGFKLWDFKGTLLYEELVDNLKQIIWRPRSPSLLSKEQQRNIRKNLKEYSRIFEQEDLAEQSSASRELVELRQRLVGEWNAWRQKWVEKLALERQNTGIVQKGHHKRSSEDEKQEYIEEYIEEVIFEETIEVE